MSHVDEVVFQTQLSMSNFGRTLNVSSGKVRYTVAFGVEIVSSNGNLARNGVVQYDWYIDFLCADFVSRYTVKVVVWVQSRRSMYGMFSITTSVTTTTLP